ncbi:MAG: hypothetical protein FWH34_06950, partial [Desulfovibrionaceae bacterium]|nr:hypothetical protein [Desulfovibrionaceae bacterium]
AKLCAAYPNMVSVSILPSAGVTSLAPLAGLKGLQSIKLHGGAKVTDLTPLAGLTEMQVLDLDGREFATPDLKWMSGMTKLTKISIKGNDDKRPLSSLEGIPSLPGLKEIWIQSAAPADLTPLVKALPALEKVTLWWCTIQDLTPLTQLANLKDLNLYGSTVKDFSPLAGCPKLQTLIYYATKDSDYSTLGKLTQVRELKSGLTKLNDISWVANLPNLRKFDVFSEFVKDYAPLGKTKVEQLTIWNMKEPVDLAQLSGAVSLTYLRVADTKAGGFSGVASLVHLQTLELTKLQDLNLAFLSKLAALTKLNLSESKVSNFEAIAQCAKLETVDLSKTTGVTSLAALKGLPNLKSITVPKGAFPEAELSGFGAKVKIDQR